MISCCGYNCETCPMFLATKYNDNDLKQELEEKYGIRSDNKCNGCLSSTSNKICQTCKIRLCCLAKHLNNCGECDIYPNCKTISFVIYTNQNSKEVLDKIYNKINKKK